MPASPGTARRPPATPDSRRRAPRTRRRCRTGSTPSDCRAWRPARRTPRRRPRPGRHIERARAVAAGAAGVEHAARSGASSGTACSRIARAKPTISSGRSPFIASADQQAGNLRRRRRAVHDRRHRAGGLVARQVLVALQLLESGAKHQHLQEVPQQDAPAFGGQHRLGMELHAVHRPRPMAQRP